jgi:hypothetical protein
MSQPLQLAREPRKVGECLVVQVHADALALGFQSLRQPECAEPQTLFACAGLCLDDGRALCLFCSTQRIEIRCQ